MLATMGMEEYGTFVLELDDELDDEFDDDDDEFDDEFEEDEDDEEDEDEDEFEDEFEEDEFEEFEDDDDDTFVLNNNSALESDPTDAAESPPSPAPCRVWYSAANSRLHTIISCFDAPVYFLIALKNSSKSTGRLGRSGDACCPCPCCSRAAASLPKRGLYRSVSETLLESLNPGRCGGAGAAGGAGAMPSAAVERYMPGLAAAWRGDDAAAGLAVKNDV